MLLVHRLIRKPASTLTLLYASLIIFFFLKVLIMSTGRGPTRTLFILWKFFKGINYKSWRITVQCNNSLYRSDGARSCTVEAPVGSCTGMMGGRRVEAWTYCYGCAGLRTELKRMLFGIWSTTAPSATNVMLSRQESVDLLWTGSFIIESVLVLDVLYTSKMARLF